MTDLIYPTLDLFLYDLRNGLGDNQLEISDRREEFLKKLPKAVHQTVRDADKFETDYRELLQPKAKVEEFETNRESNPFKGYYYPVRLGDTYGLLVDCSVENEKDPQPAKCIADLKQEIEKNQLKGERENLGKTWMISGWMPPLTEKTPEEIAIACYQSLIPDGNWQDDLDGQGKFMGADIFELSQYCLNINPEIFQNSRASSGKHRQNPANIHEIQESWHILMVICPNQQITDQIRYFYDDFMHFFAYRHKIMWCYGQSRLLKQWINYYFSEVEEYQKQIEEELNTGQQLEKSVNLLRQVQNVLNKYTIDLNRLEFQGSTIEINLSNYQKRLKRIEKNIKNPTEEQLEELPELANLETDLSFLNNFSELVPEKYLLQVQKDSQNLQQGQKLLVDIINAAKSRVEVEKADRDRKFQDLVTILGVGWAAGSFVKDYKPETPSKTITSTSPTETQSEPDSFYSNYISPLIYPVLVAIVVAIITGWVKSLCDRSPWLSRMLGYVFGKIGSK